jgi:hypothetical protein
VILIAAHAASAISHRLGIGVEILCFVRSRTDRRSSNVGHSLKPARIAGAANLADRGHRAIQEVTCAEKWPSVRAL